MIDLMDPEYAMPGQLDRLAPGYDLRTGPELAAARMDDHQRRIAEMEQRLRQVERLLQMISRAEPSAVRV